MAGAVNRYTFYSGQRFNKFKHRTNDFSITDPKIKREDKRSLFDVPPKHLQR